MRRDKRTRTLAKRTSSKLSFSNAKTMTLTGDAESYKVGTAPAPAPGKCLGSGSGFGQNGPVLVPARAVQIWDCSGSGSSSGTLFRLWLRLRAKCWNGSVSRPRQNVPAPAAPTLAPAPHPPTLTVAQLYVVILKVIIETSANLEFDSLSCLPLSSFFRSGRTDIANSPKCRAKQSVI